MPNRSGIVCPTASVFSSKAQTNKPDTQSALTNEAARAGAYTETTRRCSKDLSELSDQRGVRGLSRFGYLDRCRIVGSRCVAPIDRRQVYTRRQATSQGLWREPEYASKSGLCGTTAGDPADVAQV